MPATAAACEYASAATATVARFVVASLATAATFAAAIVGVTPAASAKLAFKAAASAICFARFVRRAGQAGRSEKTTLERAETAYFPTQLAFAETTYLFYLLEHGFAHRQI